MIREKIKNAYDAVQPDAAAADTMLQAIRAQAAARKPQKKRPVRALILVAACVAGLALLGTAGYGVYQRWHLPEPETYPFNENGAWDVHETANLTMETIPSSNDTEPLTDEYFAARAKEILSLVGQESRVSADIKITRQEHLGWAREEVEVTFTDAELSPVSVTFDAEDGTLLSLSGFEWAREGAQPCATKAEAEALATAYYEALPVPQGYVLQSCTEFDEAYWSFDFCRDVGGGIYSYYEDVRIAIDPQLGTLNGCVVFHVPLLDDHEPGDVPLTQVQAEQIAAQALDLSRYTLKSAEVTVVLPNWLFTDKFPAEGEARASKVTRLGWSLVYEDLSSEFADEIWINIDYYTGEVLGGDMTG